MEEPSLDRLIERFSTTVNFCTDMGIELGISEYMGLDVIQLLPVWMRAQPLDEDCPGDLNNLGEFSWVVLGVG